MKLEILSFGEALRYVPLEKSGVIRIHNSIPPTPIPDLVESDNWVKINDYFFNDGWSRDWKEYSEVEDKDWDKLLAIEKKEYPFMTKENLIGFYESEGYPNRRGDLFKEDFAKKILGDYEKIENKIDNLVIHCWEGLKRSPAVGIAMNEIYGWGIKDLKEKFPKYRRYVYDIMIKTASK